MLELIVTNWSINTNINIHWEKLLGNFTQTFTERYFPKACAEKIHKAASNKARQTAQWMNASLLSKNPVTLRVCF